MAVYKVIIIILTVLHSTAGQATSGIDSVGYLWLIGLILLGLLGLAVWLLQFLKRIRQDSKKHGYKQNE